jgi:hypothetical protein
MVLYVRNIVPGRILIPEEDRLDPNGHNPQKHFHVVIADVTEISDGEPYWCAVITSLIRGEHDEVVVPHSNKPGEAKTKLTKPSIAKACWQEWAYLDEFDITAGYVDPVRVLQIRTIALTCIRKTRADAITERAIKNGEFHRDS